MRAGHAPLTIVASRSHRTPETDSFIRKIEAAEIVSVGSSLKFCLLAGGEADLYPRFGRTMEWDTAAGDAVLRAAGGMTTTLDGKPLAYGKRNQAGRRRLRQPVLHREGQGGGFDAAGAERLALTRLGYSAAASFAELLPTKLRIVAMIRSWSSSSR